MGPCGKPHTYVPEMPSHRDIAAMLRKKKKKRKTSLLNLFHFLQSGIAHSGSHLNTIHTHYPLFGLSSLSCMCLGNYTDNLSSPYAHFRRFRNMVCRSTQMHRNLRRIRILLAALHQPARYSCCPSHRIFQAQAGNPLPPYCHPCLHNPDLPELSRHCILYFSLKNHNTRRHHYLYYHCIGFLFFPRREHSCQDCRCLPRQLL